ncbi:putative lipid II flippase FtsW [Terracoccus luteus]|uniref:Probable peptidoglycan glycosyltransferase FtsW n=1 Tax=Terracoccus luteus TaxID=53356 RepID=A0A839Q217_9MICO|nr:putative lipid II flippase FtsW [Terracoccus luteus]MBB2987132.1 cell division protein FtsW [Terracoccus luteus]MCP2172783.1 cell division protein FtsW [Terracoccus luteus]
MTTTTRGTRRPASATGTRPAAPRTTAGRAAAVGSAGDDARPLIGRLESPLTTYYLILGSTVTLVVFGLVMVFSASSVEQLLSDQASYGIFVRQLSFAVVGGVGAWLAMRLSVTTWRRLSAPLLIVVLLMQALVLVPGLGVSVNGNRNWLAVGPIQFQPSEFAKVALILVGALIFANKGALVARASHVLVPYVVPVVALVIALVLAGHDLGTAMVLLVIVGAVLAVAGAPTWLFGAGATVGLAGVAYMVATSSNRMDRITRFMSPECQTDPDGWCGQSVHGMYALADGGWWGVGLGASKEKWEWLSEAHNDFIFAIIGEELGLPGTLMVLVLFGVLAWACYRLVKRTQDRFVRIATAGIMAWLLGQAIINIGSVIGLFPVVGVPLPLVSAGGSSLITTIVALGILLSFARHEPGCRELLAARPGVLSRSLAVLPRRAPRAARRDGAGGSDRPDRSR